MEVNVIGAGLAGSEATYQLIKRGIKVNLYEMRPTKTTEAHKTGLFSELVCSNSLRASSVLNAVGLLKEEMKILDSLIMKSALENAVSSGGSLGVDRELFSSYITSYLKNHPLVNVINNEVETIPSGPTIICTGPLTSQKFSEAIQNELGVEYLYFYDSVAPIVSFDSINLEKAYFKSRYDKGEPAYINCPMDENQFKAFYEALISAERVVPKEFELKVFEGCMAVEDMADRGYETLLYGPLKPVGLRYPNTNITPFAVVQLREENVSKSLYNMVGFQTHLKWGSQEKVFRLIPGLENAEFVRYGVMHRNTFINAPKVLNKYYQTIKRSDLFFAGQITGVEGYLESASSGMVSGINMYRYLNNLSLIDFTNHTSIGALQNYIATPSIDFQPMNVNHGLFDEVKVRMKKLDKKEFYHQRSIKLINEIKKDLDNAI